MTPPECATPSLRNLSYAWDKFVAETLSKIYIKIRDFKKACAAMRQYESHDSLACAVCCAALPGLRASVTFLTRKDSEMQLIYL